MVLLLAEVLAIIGSIFAIAIYNDYVNQYNEADYHKTKKKKLSWALSLIWLIFVPFGCIKFVSTGEVGIKTAFGKIIATELPEGMHIVAPWEKVEKISIKVQKYENATALEASTKDLQVISGVQVAVNYQIASDKATTLFRQVGRDYNAVVLEPAIHESIKAEIAHYNAEELANARSEVSASIEKNLTERLTPYGINILAVAIQNFDYSPEYNAAIEAKAVATQEALAAKERLEKARVEAEQKIVTAEAESKANQLLQATLTDNVIKQQFIQKWDGKMPTVTGSNSILDISGLVK